MSRRTLSQAGLLSEAIASNNWRKKKYRVNETVFQTASYTGRRDILRSRCNQFDYDTITSNAYQYSIVIYLTKLREYAFSDILIRMNISIYTKDVHRS